MASTTHSRRKSHFHEIFSGLFVLFVVQKEFYRYQLHWRRFPHAEFSVWVDKLLCSINVIEYGLHWLVPEVVSKTNNERVTMSDKQATPLDAEKNKPEKVAVFRILKKISFIHTTRRRQTIFSVVGIVVILLILGMLLSSLYRTAANFDTEEFVKEIGANSAIITSSPELQGIGEDFQKVFLPASRRSLPKRLNKNCRICKNRKTNRSRT